MNGGICAVYRLLIPDNLVVAGERYRTIDKEKPTRIGMGFKDGAPDRIRTCDLSLRRGLRYPAVPRELMSIDDNQLDE